MPTPATLAATTELRDLPIGTVIHAASECSTGVYVFTYTGPEDCPIPAETRCTQSDGVWYEVVGEVVEWDGCDEYGEMCDFDCDFDY